MARYPYAAYRVADQFNPAASEASVTYPPNCQDGDLVFFWFRVAGTPGTITYPSFVTILVNEFQYTVGTNDSRATLGYFFRDSTASPSQGSALTISWDGGNEFHNLTIIGFRNIDRTTPFAVLPQNNHTTGSVAAPNPIPYNGFATVSPGQTAFLIASVQTDAVDEPSLVSPSSGWASSPDINSAVELVSEGNSSQVIEMQSKLRGIRTGESSLSGGNYTTLDTFGTASATYATWAMLFNNRALDVTDVDGDETWNDGDTGLIVTGTGLGP